MSHEFSTQTLDETTLERLKTYEALLHKWQKTINLVSNNTLPHSWERHILDSAQIEPHIPQDRETLYDLGSGAGFPGLVLAIMRPDLDVHLIESDQRKCTFLKAVSRETTVCVTVHNARIEDVVLPSPDMITARALAPLDQLLTYCTPWKREGLQALFLKGDSYQEEMDAVSKIHDVSCSVIPSQTSCSSGIIKVSWG